MDLAFARKKLICSALAGILGLAAGSASALTLTFVNDPLTAVSVLENAVLAPSSGITILPGGTYQGSTSVQQSATYTGFSLAPSSGSSPTLVLPNGIFLTSGTANIPTSNTTNNFNVAAGSGSNALLTTLAGASTNDANALSFSFSTVAGRTSVSAQFVFGTEEFPTQAVTDIFGFFVDGVNYARFPGGELISNTSGNPTNFIANPVGAGLYPIEFNGLTQVFTVTGLLNASQSVHTLTIAVADTSDTIFDSGVFVAGLTSGNAASGTGGGITIGTPDNGPGSSAPIPEPGSMALFAAGLGLLGWRARRKSA